MLSLYLTSSKSVHWDNTLIKEAIPSTVTFHSKYISYLCTMLQAFCKLLWTWSWLTHHAIKRTATKSAQCEMHSNKNTSMWEWAKNDTICWRSDQRQLMDNSWVLKKKAIFCLVKAVTSNGVVQWENVDVENNKNQLNGSVSVCLSCMRPKVHFYLLTAPPHP